MAADDSRRYTHEGSVLASSTGDGLMLRVQVASTAGYVTKKFPKDATFRHVIEKVNESLPENVRSTRYRMFVNGLRVLDDSRTIASQGIKTDVRFDATFIFLLIFAFSSPKLCIFNFAGQTLHQFFSSV
jgi:hypothetical protein